jgi:riboflavin kinase
MTTSVTRLKGIVNGGTGKSKLFTELPWVRKQYREKLGIDPVPGTFNITVVQEDWNKLNSIRNAAGIEIVSEDGGYCAAKTFVVLINHRINGAAIIPLVPDYPERQLEIVSAEYIRRTFSLKDGDIVEVEVSV